MRTSQVIGSVVILTVGIFLVPTTTLLAREPAPQTDDRDKVSPSDATASAGPAGSVSGSRDRAQTVGGGNNGSHGDSNAESRLPGDNPADFLVDQLSIIKFHQNIVDLAGCVSRYWNQPGNLRAVNYIKVKLESYGYTNVVLDPYNFGGQTKHNVYATKMGTVNPTQMYIVSGHLDSFSNVDVTDAPGADDDASGTALVLELARVFAKARVDTSVRFILWNNEETGLNGSEAYVDTHRALQGTLTEPTWVGVIQHDMILYDRARKTVPDADVEYNASHIFGGQSIDLANFVAGAMERYGTMPAEVTDNMNNTDSVSFWDDVASISVRENRRLAEIGAGSNPQYHEPTDLPETYTAQDYEFGFNIVKMTAGAVAELVNAEPDCNMNDISDAVDIAGGAPDTNGDGVPDVCQDCNSNGILDPIEIADMTTPDCNGNGIPDECDLAAVTSNDCNSNLIPDDCELDCQPNFVPDDCDLASGASLDCGPNGIPDDCEADLDGNGIADACERVPPQPENALGITTCMVDVDCSNEAYCVPDVRTGFPGTCYVPKNRYLSMVANPANTFSMARRLSIVTFERSCGGAGNTSCTSNSQCSGNADGTTCDDVRTGSQVLGWFGQPDVDGFVGIVDEENRFYTTWIDLTFPVECGVDALCPPGAHCDVGLGATNTCRLNADQTEVLSSVVHLSACHISPKKRNAAPGVDENRAANYYLIEAIAEGLSLQNAANYSVPLELRTVVVWGDLTGGTANNVALPPDNGAGFLDILDQVKRFKDKGEATTPWLDLDPQVPDHGVAFLDMLQGVNGFKDQPYPFDNPCLCAGLPPCE
ncbi:MAG: M20/M25/M40 family metallo-hydrolase [Planctomycetes bacterium]|nr:M20/M25/M40 family metallo-hydrolase [Planctomycetota bacterium]